MSAALRKGEWLLSYDDGSDKVTVGFDVAAEHCPTVIRIQYSSDQWVYVDVEDAAWVAARLLDAAEHIRKAKGLNLGGERSMGGAGASSVSVGDRVEFYIEGGWRIVNGQRVAAERDVARVVAVYSPKRFGEYDFGIVFDGSPNEGLLRRSEVVNVLPRAAKPMSETGWQPIETAPKDGGQDILVYVEESGEQFVAFYDREMWVYALRPGGGQTCCEATHWMPLPPPPGENQ